MLYIVSLSSINSFASQYPTHFYSSRADASRPPSSSICLSLLTARDTAASQKLTGQNFSVRPSLTRQTDAGYNEVHVHPTVRDAGYNYWQLANRDRRTKTPMNWQAPSSNLPENRREKDGQKQEHAGSKDMLVAREMVTRASGRKFDSPFLWKKLFRFETKSLISVANK